MRSRSPIGDLGVPARARRTNSKLARSGPSRLRARAPDRTCRCASETSETSAETGATADRCQAQAQTTPGHSPASAIHDRGRAAQGGWCGWRVLCGLGEGESKGRDASAVEDERRRACPPRGMGGAVARADRAQFGSTEPLPAARGVQSGACEAAGQLHRRARASRGDCMSGRGKGTSRRATARVVSRQACSSDNGHRDSGQVASSKGSTRSN